MLLEKLVMTNNMSAIGTVAWFDCRKIAVKAGETSC
jgi:hypothetical protein